MPKRGYVKIYRDIQEHWLWQDKPFDMRSAWLDLLLMANHEDNTFLLGKDLLTVKRGQLITSEIKLMERWGWSKSKVRRFLQLLQNDEMIVKKSDCKKTALDICNYSTWQDFKTTKEPEKDHKRTSKEPVKDTNKNVKNDKNNNIYICGDFVSMSEDEHQKLIDQFGQVKTNKLIEILDNYKGAKGVTYKSDYRAILSWVVKSYDRDNKKSAQRTANFEQRDYDESEIEGLYFDPK